MYGSSGKMESTRVQLPEFLAEFRTALEEEIDHITYIYRHDLSEECREKQEKKKQVEKALLREQVNSIRAVQTQINKQNRKKKGTKESNSVKRRRNKQNLRNIANAFRDYKAAAAAHI